jgi:hypothetical protein
MQRTEENCQLIVQEKTMIMLAGKDFHTSRDMER